MPYKTTHLLGTVAYGQSVSLMLSYADVGLGALRGWKSRHRQFDGVLDDESTGRDQSRQIGLRSSWRFHNVANL